MNKRLLTALVVVFLLVPVAVIAMQEDQEPEPEPGPRLAISGVNASDLPLAEIQDAVVRVDPPAGRARTVTADPDGVFRLCVDPGPEPAIITAFRPGDVAALTSTGDSRAAQGGERVDVQDQVTRRQDLTVGMGEARVFATWANRISGAVLTRSGREPVAGVSITMSDTLGRRITTVVSNEEGQFQLPHPGSGERFNLRAEHIAYADATGVVDFGARDELNVELLMATRPIELEPIVVVERRRDYLAEVGYYMRKDRGLGKFIDRVDIELRKPTQLTDIVRRTPGVTITGYGLAADIEMMGARRAGGFEGSSFMGTTGTGGMKCRPAVYVDGALVRPGGTPRTRTLESELGTSTVPGTAPLNQIVSPEAIEAVEVYRRASEVPARYSGADAACGVLAIWTRR